MVQSPNAETLLKPKALDLDDTVEISWDLQADIHSPEMVSKILADVEGNGIRSLSPLASNLLPRVVRALDEALPKAGPESSLVSLIKRIWDIRLGKMKIQQVPGLQFIVKTWRFQEISPQNCSRIPIPVHTATKVSEQRTFQPYQQTPPAVQQQHMQQQELQEMQMRQTNPQQLRRSHSPTLGRMQSQAMAKSFYESQFPMCCMFDGDMGWMLDEDIDSESEEIVQGLL